MKHGNEVMATCGIGGDVEVTCGPRKDIDGAPGTSTSSEVPTTGGGWGRWADWRDHRIRLKQGVQVIERRAVGARRRGNRGLVEDNVSKDQQVIERRD
jgi:hypothetical protein